MFWKILVINSSDSSCNTAAFICLLSLKTKVPLSKVLIVFEKQFFQVGMLSIFGDKEFGVIN